MGVYDSYKKHKAKKEQQNEPSPMPVAPAPQTPAADPVPAPGDVNTPDAMPQAPAAETPMAPVAETRAVNGSPNAMPEEKQSLTSVAAKPDLTIKQDKTPAWVKVGSYEDLVKINPNWSRGQYAYELGKYRRENGMPDLSYAEWANIIKGQDPYETEAERQKREKNMRTASQINALGSFLNALVNYNRVKSGHVGYTPDKGTEAYNRLERMRLGQEQLARSNARDYLGALAQDRAERAKEAAAEAAAKEKERNYEIKKADLEWKIQNAKNEAGRKAAADELARLKFEHQKAKDAAALKETKRHNQASEAISRERAKNGGGSGTKKYLELETSSGTKRYTPEEYGNNWIHQAYQDMLKEPEGKKFAVQKYGGIMGGSSVPSEQEMYDAITKYNDSQWKNQYRSNRYGGGGEAKPPLE